MRGNFWNNPQQLEQPLLKTPEFRTTVLWVTTQLLKCRFFSSWPFSPFFGGPSVSGDFDPIRPPKNGGEKNVRPKWHRPIAQLCENSESSSSFDVNMKVKLVNRVLPQTFVGLLFGLDVASLFAKKWKNRSSGCPGSHNGDNCKNTTWILSDPRKTARR